MQGIELLSFLIIKNLHIYCPMLIIQGFKDVLRSWWVHLVGKGTCNKPNDLSFILSLTWWKERTNFYKLSSDSYTHPLTSSRMWACVHTHTHINNKSDKIKIHFLCNKVFIIAVNSDINILGGNIMSHMSRCTYLGSLLNQVCFELYLGFIILCT